MADHSPSRAEVLVDLRSDTVTRPSPAMRAAMAEAAVGDDVYDEDPTVHALQSRIAELFGHEAALFVPSGTMGNQIALRLLVSPGQELLCDADAHVVTYEMGSAAALGGISSRTWPARGGHIDVDEVAETIRPAGYAAVPTRAIAVEQTHNRAGGAIIPLQTLRELRGVADAAGVRMHCDGARIWHAHVATGVSLLEYGRLFDTLSVCLSKGLGAPIGSLVVGSAEHIDRARDIRKGMGGGMRQVGLLAAAGDHAVRHHIAPLAEDHRRARRLAEALAPFGVVEPAQVTTNIVMLNLRRSPMGAADYAALARQGGVLVSVFGPTLARLVTHRDVNDVDIDRAIEVLVRPFVR